MYEGNHIRLRALTPQDAEKTLAYVNDYDTSRSFFAGALYPSTHEDEMRFISQQSSYTRGEYQFAIETLADEFIGTCGFSKVDWKNGVATLGIIIGEAAHRGKGYGLEALNLLAHFAFQELNLQKLKLSVFEYNTPAIRCYEKAGYQLEGRLRRELYREGAYHDVLAMGLLREEWRAAK